jgi:hypothetical protein
MLKNVDGASKSSIPCIGNRVQSNTQNVAGRAGFVLVCFFLRERNAKRKDLTTSHKGRDERIFNYAHKQTIVRGQGLAQEAGSKQSGHGLYLSGSVLLSLQE